jgi:hypothetical protein
MPLPTLSEAQINSVIQQVAEYIESQRQKYRGDAAPLDQSQKALMAPFFPQSVLDSARVLVLNGERVSNPPFYSALVEIGFDPALLPDFTHMGAITFVDTIVSHGPMSAQTLFHELVHVVQYEELGLEDFAAKYVTGFLTGGSYEGIPLEQNAYQLDARFAKAPASAFSVVDEVQEWMDFELF